MQKVFDEFSAKMSKLGSKWCAYIQDYPNYSKDFGESDSPWTITEICSRYASTDEEVSRYWDPFWMGIKFIILPTRVYVNFRCPPKFMNVYLRFCAAVHGHAAIYAMRRLAYESRQPGEWNNFQFSADGEPVYFFRMEFIEEIKLEEYMIQHIRTMLPAISEKLVQLFAFLRGGNVARCNPHVGQIIQNFNHDPRSRDCGLTDLPVYLSSLFWISSIPSLIPFKVYGNKPKLTLCIEFPPYFGDFGELLDRLTKGLEKYRTEYPEHDVFGYYCTSELGGLLYVGNTHALEGEDYCETLRLTTFSYFQSVSDQFAGEWEP